MASRTVSCISKMLLSILVFAGLSLGPTVIWAQNYTEEEYKQYQDIKNEQDLAKKADMIFRFIREKPKNELVSTLTSEFQNIIAELHKEKRWSLIITLGERFLDISPNDSFTVTALASAYSETKNNKGFAVFGEKVYAQKPSVQLARGIANAYLELKNDEKFIQWAEKVLASDPNEFELSAELTRKFMLRQNAAQAAKYAKMALAAIPNAKQPQGTSEAKWKNYVDGVYALSYASVGMAAYENKRYRDAVTNLENSIKYHKNNETAYYHMGLCYWQLGKTDAAMLNFAKAWILRGATAKGAKQYLDQLWKTGHKGSLAGVERVIERAQQDLK
jgi:tetratricopeptide (TPR) repeat protein